MVVGLLAVICFTLSVGIIDSLFSKPVFVKDKLQLMAGICEVIFASSMSACLSVHLSLSLSLSLLAGSLARSFSEAMRCSFFFNVMPMRIYERKIFLIQRQRSSA